MRTIGHLRALALAVAPAMAAGPAAGLAAHAVNPYRNVDHSNGAGSESGVFQSTPFNDRGPVEVRVLSVAQSTARTPPAHAPR